MLPKINISKILLVKIVLSIYYLVGVIGLLHPLTYALFQQLIPFTLISTLVVLLFFHGKWEKRHIGVFLLLAVLGFLVEVVGIATGLVFGEYEYGHTLGFELWGTPPIIGLNWLLLVYAIYGFWESYRLPALAKILLGALMLVGLDVALEPVAIALNMWSWAGGAVPFQNYVAWFVISVVFLGIMHLAKIKLNNPVAGFVYFLQLIFFVILCVLL